MQRNTYRGQIERQRQLREQIETERATESETELEGEKAKTEVGRASNRAKTLVYDSFVNQYLSPHT